MTETVEQMIQDRGLNAPRLTPSLIESKIVGETYTVLPSGKVLVCELTLVNGFTVRGEASVVSRENFNEEVGRRVSRENAVRQIWPLEGYLLQQRLFDGACQHEMDVCDSPVGVVRYCKKCTFAEPVD